MSAKEKLVATLVNHWYCMDRSHQLGIAKRLPPVAKYREKLDGLNMADDKAVKAVDDHFCRQNRKAMVWVFSHLLKQAGAKNATVEAKTRGKTIQITVPVEDFSQTELTQYQAMLHAPDQQAELGTLLTNLPLPNLDVSKACFDQEIKCGQTEFYENLSHLDKLTSTLISDWMKFLSVCRLLRDTMPKADLTEALSGQLHVVFKTLEFKECEVASYTFEAIETADARASRELKARLEEALKRRTKKVKDLAVSAGSFTYSFEDPETPPLTFNLDVITDW